MSVHDVLRRAETEARPCVRLDASSERSTSYLGGLPEMPAGAGWPTWNGAPLAFLGQLDLSGGPAAAWPDWMPRDGKLLFFYDAEQSTWGFDPKDRGSWAVLFLERDAVCAEHLPPEALSEYARFRRKDVVMVEGRSLPSIERLGAYQSLSDEEFDALNDHLCSVAPDCAHQMFGWPNPVQDDSMELDSQLVSNGIYLGNPDGYHDPRAASLEAGADDWSLLLQLDTDDACDMMWGDVGKLYFWIRREDARRRDFSGVWMVLQCS